MAALTKRYGRVTALSGLDLSVGSGEVYGFLGRNGAGKSTTIRILMGITKPDGGEVRLFGESTRGAPVHLRQRIGYVAQEQSFYEWMTAGRLARFVAGFYPTWDQASFERLCKEQESVGGMKAKAPCNSLYITCLLRNSDLPRRYERVRFAERVADRVRTRTTSR